MGETSVGYKSWEEEMYWTHFQMIHFSQFLRGSFREQLPLPEKFGQNIKKKLPETVTLKGPSGLTWDVELTKNDDALFFSRGWKDFVRDNSLEENDFLIFKYNGVSNFDVLIFDAQSLCEKEALYFVKKSVRAEHDSKYQRKRKVMENPVGTAYGSPRSYIECSSKKSARKKTSQIRRRKPSNCRKSNKKMQNGSGSGKQSDVCQSLGGKTTSTFAGEMKVKNEYGPEGTPESGHNENDQIPSEKPTIFRNAKKKMQNQSKSLGHSDVCQNPGDEEPSTFAGEATVKTETKANAFSNMPQGLQPWPVTEAEKRNALQLAQAALSSEGFMVVMKPTHVKKKYFLTIPTEWLKKRMTLEHQDVILRFNQNEWGTKFHYYPYRGFGGLAGGWRQFAVENKLDEDDICIFEPVKPQNTPIKLDVTIFHVPKSVIPLSIVAP